MCVCVCLRGGEGAQTRAVEKIAFSGCTQAELCGSRPDKYVYTVSDLCTLILLCQVETTSHALLQAWLAPLVPALCVCIVRAQILLTSKLRWGASKTQSSSWDKSEYIGIKFVEWHYSLLAWLKPNETMQQWTRVSPWYEGSCHKGRHQHAEAFSNVKWISIDLLAYDLSMWQTLESIRSAFNDITVKVTIGYISENVPFINSQLLCFHLTFSLLSIFFDLVLLFPLK